jgi:hypothetical protein
MQPDDAASNIQDSVVGGNLHTGNVVHHHYHSQTPSIASRPQTITGIPAQIEGVQVSAYGTPLMVEIGGPNKSLRTASWILVLIGLVGGFVCGGLCLLVPIGLIPEAMYLHQSINWKKKTGAPTGGDTASLILVYLFLIASIVGPIYIMSMLMSSDSLWI